MKLGLEHGWPAVLRSIALAMHVEFDQADKHDQAGRIALWGAKVKLESAASTLDDMARRRAEVPK
jgi:hypothetical protein